MFVRLTDAQLAAAQERRLAGHPLQKSKGQKYANKKVTTPDGATFDSRAEYRHWQHLQKLERSGEIKDLRRQVPFVLAPAAKIAGKTKPALRYIADFCYKDSSGKTVVADTKGAVTEVWKIKRHLMMSVHGIEVREIRA